MGPTARLWLAAAVVLLALPRHCQPRPSHLRIPDQNFQLPKRFVVSKGVMQQQMNAARSRLLRGNDEEGVSIDDGTIPLLLAEEEEGYVDLDLDDAELEDWEGRAAEDQGQPWALVAGAAGGSPVKRGATPDSGVDMWVEAEDVTDILADQLAAEMQPLMEDVEAAVALAAGRQEPAPLDLIPHRVGEEALAAEAALEAAALAAPGSQAATAVPAAPLTAGEGSHSRARMHRWPGGAERLEVGGPARRKAAVDDGDE